MALALVSKPKHASTGRSASARNKKAMPGRNHTSRQFGSDVARIGLPTLTPRHPVIQAKLKIGEPNDKYEQEADRVADAVMRMPETNSVNELTRPKQSPGQRIQRLCTECEDELQRQPAKENVEDLQALTTLGQNSEATSDMRSRLNALKGGGGPLPQTLRSFFEPRFGHDFGKVRIHTSQGAAESARAINARAFTAGEHVVFGAGEYRPGTSGGRRLLGHELTHVVQQRRSLGSTLQRQARAAPNYRDCTPAITGRADANQRIENARQRARRYVGAAIRALAAAPTAGSVYATALGRHFIAPTAAQRRNIRTTYQQIMRELQVRNFICNTGEICPDAQAFWNPEDELIHVCPHFWDRETTICQAIIFVHEAAHDVGINVRGGEAPYRGFPAYPTGNVAPPAGQTTAARLNYPDSYAFFAAHIARNTDIGKSCF